MSIAPSLVLVDAIQSRNSHQIFFLVSRFFDHLPYTKTYIVIAYCKQSKLKMESSFGSLQSAKTCWYTRNNPKLSETM